jgi:glucan phosphoethanolaminetransferase (alkaline phosphatase superfamily)
VFNKIIKGAVLLSIIIAMIIFLITMTLIILNVVNEKVKRKKKIKIIIIILILISCVVFGAYQYFQRSSSFIFTKTTNIEETISGLQLYDSIDSKEFVKEYGTNLKSLDNTLYDYYSLNDSLVIATNKQKQIIRILANDKAISTLKTGKGIKFGSQIDEVIKVYGENNYKRMSDIGVPVIGYVDKKRKINIEFFNYENKVIEIRYGINSVE